MKKNKLPLAKLPSWQDLPRKKKKVLKKLFAKIADPNYGYKLNKSI